MRRDDALYEWGMVVNHNTGDVIPGRGSAIFLHVWSGRGKPTAGCTAMSREDLLRVMTWLRSDARPVLVQVPLDELERLQRKSVGSWPAPPRAVLAARERSRLMVFRSGRLVAVLVEHVGAKADAEQAHQVDGWVEDHVLQPDQPDTLVRLNRPRGAVRIASGSSG